MVPPTVPVPAVPLAALSLYGTSPQLAPLSGSFPSQLIQADFKISQMLHSVTLCVCVCCIAAWAKVAKLQNSSSNIQKSFHYENDLKRRQAMEQENPT